jgi:hypothetical protein
MICQPEPIAAYWLTKGHHAPSTLLSYASQIAGWLAAKGQLAYWPR